MRRFVLVMTLLVTGCAFNPGARRPTTRQAIDLFHPDSTRRGYGWVDETGYVEVFSPSGERLFHGTVKGGP